MNTEQNSEKQASMLDAVHALKKKMLLDALKTSSTLSEAARKLGVNPRLVRYLMQKYGIERSVEVKRIVTIKTKK